MKIKHYLSCASILALLFIGCEKKPALDSTSSEARDALTLDSVFLYAQQTYLWNDLLPSYEEFNPRSFKSPKEEVEKIKSYSLYDKYSFIDNGEVSDELGGVSGDYGFSVNFNGGHPQDLRISYVYEGSPADKQSLKRGYQIVEINGRSDIDGRNSSFFDFLLDAVFGSKAVINLKVKKFDGSIESVSVNRGKYSIQPVLYHNIYSCGSKKIGYFVFNSFLQLSGGSGSAAFKSSLDNLFAYFQQQNIKEIIIDLRYNGGGSVETADYLADYLAPAGTKGVMHTDIYNKTMQTGRAVILKNQKFTFEGEQYSYFDFDYSPGSYFTVSKFEKKGTLNLSRIYFLVSSSTASASELLINSLKPVMPVKLIGRNTYGKPVGFFPIHIDKYDLYIPQFKTQNRNGEGDYFNGMLVDKDEWDDVSREFGDERELYLAYALNYAAKGNFNLPGQATTSAQRTVARMSAEEADRAGALLNRTKFKGMIKEEVFK